MNDITIISKPPAMDVNIENAAVQIINEFFEALYLQKTPGKTCYDIKKRIDEIAEEWRKRKQYNTGRQPESFMLHYAIGNRYLEVVNRFAKTEIKYKNNTLMDFDKKTVAVMISIQAAFHYAKFGSIVFYEMELAAILILFKYVKLFEDAYGSMDDKVWCVTYEDIKELFELIPYINQYDKNFYNYVIKKREIKKPKTLKRAKPECADDYLKFYQNGWNVDQWIEELHKQWGQSRMTIFRYFQKFGIEPKKITKNLLNIQYGREENS